jgi:hypothetical protein
MTSTEPAPLQRQRVRRSRKPAKTNPLRNPRLGRLIFIGMSLAAVAFFAGSARTVDYAGKTFGPAGIDGTRDDVRYMLGQPKVAPGTDPATAPRWQYRLPEGGTVLAEFDPDDGLVRRLSCEDANMTPASCPNVLGVRMGDAETHVLYRLGVPSRQQFAGEVKSLIYDDLGITFQLTRFAVYKVIIGRRPSRFSYLPRTFRYMVP